MMHKFNKFETRFRMAAFAGICFLISISVFFSSCKKSNPMSSSVGSGNQAIISKLQIEPAVDTFNTYNPDMDQFAVNIHGFLDEMEAYTKNPNQSFPDRPVDFAIFQMETSINYLYNNVCDSTVYPDSEDSLFIEIKIDDIIEEIPVLDGKDLLANAVAVEDFATTLPEGGELIAINVTLYDLDEDMAYFRIDKYIGGREAYYEPESWLFEYPTYAQAIYDESCFSSAYSHAAWRLINQHTFRRGIDAPAIYGVLYNFHAANYENYDRWYWDTELGIYTQWGAQNKIWSGYFAHDCLNYAELNEYLQGNRYMYRYFVDVWRNSNRVVYLWDMGAIDASEWSEDPNEYLSFHWARWATCDVAPLNMEE